MSGNRRLRPREAAPAAQRRSGPGLRERLAAFAALHGYSLVSSLGRLGARPWATLLTVGVMAVALALPAGLLLALSQLEGLAGDLREARALSLFMEAGQEGEAAAALAARLRQRADVASVAVRTPEQGLAEFREMTAFAGALAVLDYNPLPAVLVVDPADGADPAALAAALEAEPGAAFVQHDALWRERLAAWLGLGARLAWVVALLLGLGALLVVGNTVRLDIQGRAEEIAIVQLLGATDGFVRRPFLYLGAWYGLFAGLLALLLVLGAVLALRAPAAALAGSYGGSVPALAAPLAGGSAALLAVAMLLGWLGAWLAAGHHLRQARPGA
jgi:cell division transport system permease protein